MNQLAPHLLTVEEFIVWSQAQPGGRYELDEGRIIRMASETVGHVRVKFRVAVALTRAVQDSTSPVFVLTDGATVRINAKTAYEPDAMVYAGPELPDDVIEIDHPIIVVEVLSPSSGARDGTQKLRNYFKVPTIQHYLIVDPENRLIVHHRRGTKSSILTETTTAGLIELDPPGISLQAADFFPTA